MSILFHSWRRGFPSSQWFHESLTADAGYVLESSEQCCYRTYYMMNKDMAYV
jgi:hypothetical protein